MAHVITHDDITIGVFGREPLQLRTKHNLVIELNEDEVLALIAGLAETAHNHTATFLCFEVDKNNLALTLADRD